MPFQPGVAKTPAEATANYVTGATAKAQVWKDRVLKPKRLFTDAAIANSQTWLNKINQVGTAGFEDGMRRVNLTEVAANIEKSGAASYSTGIQNKSPKFNRAMTKLLPIIQAEVANLPAGGDLEANIARSADFQRRMAAHRGEARG